MARVFISYASQDLAIASRVAGWLRDAGHTVFVDQDHDGLRVGDTWADRLFTELYAADGLVAVVTAAFVESPWCAAEVGIARAHGVRILPIRVERGVAHRLITSETLWTDLDGDGSQACAALTKALRQLSGTGGAAWSAGLPIYPGLVPFDAGQARVFFGREQETRRLAERLRAPEGAGLLAVVGPSGCGKSSLVRAGLGPLLAAEPDWLVLSPLIPTSDPAADPTAALERLLAAEARHRGLNPLKLPDGLAPLAADLLADAAPARRLLLVVDQAEELFTSTAESDRHDFATLLREVTSSGQVRVVATVRSEFLDPLAALSAQARLPLASFVLAPLARDLLPLVITGPARHAGINVDDELVARMAADTGSGDALPLLAFVLNQLVQDVPRSGTLSPRRYAELGGVQGALAGQADRALAAATAISGRTATDVIATLLRLVTVDEAGQVSRRPVAMASLPAPAQAELEVFVTYRLLTATSDEPTFAFAHEQILSAWPPLAAAIASTMDTLRLRASTTDAADTWDRAGRPTDHLWEFSRATNAATTLRGDDLAPTTHEFLTTSTRHGRRRRLRALAVLSILLLLVTAGGIVAVTQWQDAVSQGRIATARALAGEAEGLRATNPRLSLKLALAAGKVDGRVATRNLLANVLTATSIRAVLPADFPSYLSAVALTSGGHTALSSGLGQDAIVWNMTDPDHPVRRTTLANGYSGALSADGRIALTGGNQLVLWDLTDPARATQRVAFNGHLGGISAVALTPDGRTALSSGHDKTAVLWDLTDSAHPAKRGSFNLVDERTPVALSANGRIALTGGFDNTSILWDLTDPGRPIQRATLTGHLKEVRAVSLTSDGSFALTGGFDKTAILWDLADPARPTPRATLAGHTDAVYGVALTPDGRTALTGSRDKTAILWNLTDPERPTQRTVFTGHTELISAVALAPDGRTALTASSDNIAILWRHTQPPLQSTFARSPAALTPNGHTALTGNTDGSAALWDLTNPASPRRQTTLADHSNPVSAVALSGDGRTAMTASMKEGTTSNETETTIVWDVADQSHPAHRATLPAHTGASGVALTADGRTALTGGDSNTVILWDLTDPDHPTQRAALKLPGPWYGRVQDVAVSEDGRTALTVQGNAVVWDLTDPTHPAQRAVITGPVLPDRTDAHREDFISAAALAADGRTALTGNDSDRTAILWDLTNPTNPIRRATLADHPGPVSSAALGANGRIALTGSDKSVSLWDLSDPASPVRFVLPSHTEFAGGAALTADGHTALTGGPELALWNLTELLDISAHVIDRACAASGGGLSRDEWSLYVPDIPYVSSCR